MRNKGIAVGAICCCLLAAGLAAAAADVTGLGSGPIETPVPADIDTKRAAPNIWDLAAHRGGFVAALADLAGQDVFRAVRYRRDGSLDRRFGADGFTRPLRLKANLQAQGIATQRDGRIVLAGFSQSPGYRRVPLVVRFRPDGSLDRSFGRGGIVNPRRVRRGGGAVHDVAIQPGGRVVVAGTIGEHGIGRNSFRSAGFLAAYKRDGSVDRSFGNGGRVNFDLPRPDGDYSGLKAVLALRDGRLLVSGFEDGELFLARLLADGRLDRSFGGGTGTVAMSLFSPGACYATCWSASPLAVRSDGRIVVAASAFPFPPRVLRLRPDGSLDPSFGHEGRVKVGGGQLGFSAFGLGLQRNRIVLAGWDERQRGKSQLSFSVLRYRGDGRIDRGFGRHGRVVQPRGEFSGAFAVLPQPRGRILVGGGGTRQLGGDPPRSHLQLARYPLR